MKPEINIVALINGFVYVGKTTLENGWLTIRNASNIRRWGTTQGLGQLALKGPQENTLLDPCGTVHAPLGAVIFQIECVVEKWSDKL